MRNTILIISNQRRCSWPNKKNIIHTVESPVSGHTRDAEKVSATGAGRLRECENSEFKRGFVKAAVSRAVRKLESFYCI